MTNANEAGSILEQEKEKAAKEAEKKLNKVSLGQSGYVSGKEKNSLRDQFGLRTPATPLVSNKVGRNSLCPCGSKNTGGSRKKYKYCCGKF